MLKVTICVPLSRNEDLPNVLANYHRQDYPNKELCIFNDDGATEYMSIEDKIYVWGESGKTIGHKRNELTRLAKGDIVIFQDSDDFYAYNYVSLCIKQLETANVTGLSSAYFYKPHSNLYLYEYGKHQPYVLESGMAFRREVWERCKFADTNNGEGLKFLTNAGRISPIKTLSAFVAILHNKNTQSGRDMSIFKPVDISLAKGLLGESYYLYG